MEELKKIILALLLIISILFLAFVFRHHIVIQAPLKIEQLNEMVEKEIIEIYGRN
jgi:hypothetical protein